MIWIIVLICLIFVLCRQSGFEANRKPTECEIEVDCEDAADADAMLAASKGRVRNPYYRPSDQPEAELAPAGVVENLFYFAGVLIREVTPILQAILVETLEGWVGFALGLGGVFCGCFWLRRKCWGWGGVSSTPFAVTRLTRIGKLTRWKRRLKRQ